MPYLAKKRLFHNGRFVEAGGVMEEPIKRSILQLGWAKWDDTAPAQTEKKEIAEEKVLEAGSNVVVAESPRVEEIVEELKEEVQEAPLVVQEVIEMQEPETTILPLVVQEEIVIEEARVEKTQAKKARKKKARKE